MVEGHMYRVAMDFIRGIKGSEEFREYKAGLERIQEEPDLYDKVNEFRKKNYMLQNAEDSEDYIERLEELDREFEDVRAIPMVDDFLAAELGFCRMMQEINQLVWEEIDFQ
ncbi:MAG: YlbF family regulator [Kineothrix sp.]|jgi:cell fate (sporulation/competence/biofilm development) regulator YlbF (YheA/YmcA/DUF963 family)|nr:hypothetical protein C807_02399 [Lachnospiraceae bacterium 28-4]MCI8845834.1 YlbF family regulator [Lachnospiraceae bacterium]MCX4344841.1 YlbF family regulator [Kineothrix sp.]